MAKNRRVLEELTRLRVSWETLTSEHAKSEEQLGSLQEQMDKVKGLNEKLENDLMMVNKGGDDNKSVSGYAVGGAGGLAGLDIGGKTVVSPSLTTLMQVIGLAETDGLGGSGISSTGRYFNSSHRHFSA